MDNKAIVGIVIAVVFFLVGYGVGCGVDRSSGEGQQANDTAKEEASNEPIKIGFIGPLTGDAAVYGEPVENVTKLAVKEINASGGINGRPLEVIYEDSLCDGKGAATAMQKLANVDKLEFVIGGFCSSESLGAAPIANEHKIVLFSPGSSSAALTIFSSPALYLAPGTPSSLMPLPRAISGTSPDGNTSR